jgi:hypothetical protein
VGSKAVRSYSKQNMSKEAGNYPLKLTLEERRFLRLVGNTLGMPVSSILLTAIRDWLVIQNINFDSRLFQNRTAGRPVEKD